MIPTPARLAALLWIPVAASGATFDGVRGWEGLRLGMNPADARQALRSVGMAFEERRSPKDGRIAFRLVRDGWSVTAHFDESEHLGQILLESPRYATETEALAAILQLEREHGPATVARAGYEDETRSDRVWEWRNDAVVLVATVAAYREDRAWVVWRSYGVP